MDQHPMHGRTNLTPKQAEIYRLIVGGHISGTTPTQQEIADELGVTKTTIYTHTDALVKKGYIKKDGVKARGMAPIEPVDERYADIESPTDLLADAVSNLMAAIDTPDRDKYKRLIDRVECAVMDVRGH